MKNIKKNRTKVKSRKELRKAKRQEKKSRRNEYFSKKNKSFQRNENNLQNSIKQSTSSFKNQSFQDDIHQKHNHEKKQEFKLEKEMQKQRKQNLLQENEKEDKIIKSLEKQLKLNKRKTNSIPKSFRDDGLDYLLEICDTETRKHAASIEKQFNTSNLEDDFEEDFAIATGKKESSSQQLVIDELNSEYDSFNEESEQDVSSEDDLSDNCSNNYEDLLELDETDSSSIKISKKKVISTSENKSIIELCKENNKCDSDSNEQEQGNIGLWEDIYGRKRDNEGNFVKIQEKYLPPAVRARMIAEKNENTNVKNSEKLIRLHKQIKGLLNRLAESNLINIATQIEQLYNANSRYDMNSALMKFTFEAIISPVLTPFRQVANYALLITVLHANVDTEVGANFLQNVVLKFNTLVQQDQPAENKELENVVHIICQLYNLKIFQAQLLHELLWRLLKFDKNCESVFLSERCLECALLILRTTGPTLRKDDPLALRNTVLKMQDSVANTPTNIRESSRFKFLFNVLMAIKNNNFTKIPNYDPDNVEHLRKVLRSAVRKGNSVVQLNILYDDLLKAEENGRWWIVGSAWSGQHIIKNDDEDRCNRNEIKPIYSQQLLDLAQKQRMNTDIRRNIFCIVMSAEDYLDAFEKLLRLGLRPQQEREVVHVLLHCNIQEKMFNPYYSLILQKFCDYDRKYQIGIQCAIWDKLKELNVYTSQKIKNLAKTLTYLFLQGGLPISVLKVVQLSELDKSLLRLFRQILLGVMLSENTEASIRVWERIAHASSLRQFRQGLRLFIYHFLLKDSVLETLPENDRELLKQRAKVAEKYLAANEQKVIF